jgi:signal transduction histidine kinase
MTIFLHKTLAAKGFCLLIFFYFFSFVVCGQQKKIDSLQNLLSSHQKEDSERIKLLLSIAKSYLYVDTSKVSKYLAEALVISEKHKLILSHIETLENLAYFQIHIKGQHRDAINSYQKAIVLCDKLTGVEDKIANCLYGIGFEYYVIGDYDKAMIYAVKTINLKNTNNNLVDIANANDLIGLIYTIQKEPQKAIVHQEKALEIAQKTQNLPCLSAILNNLGASYVNLKLYNKALSIYQKSMNIYEQMQDSIGMTYPIHNIGDVYLQMKNYKKALPYFLLSMRVYGQSGSNLDAALDYTKSATCYLYLGDIKKAEKYILRSLEMATSNQEFNSVMEAYFLIAKIDSVKQNYMLSLKHYQKARQLQDSLFGKEKYKELARLQTLYDVEKKEKENELLKKEQQIKDVENTKKLTTQKYALALVALALLSALTVVFFVYRGQQRERKAKNLIIKQKQELEQSKEEIQTQAEQLNNSNQAKDRLFAIIAHDLRSPLVSFQGIAKQLDFYLRKDKPEKIRELGEKINESTQNINSLLDNLLNWALVQREAISLNPQKLLLKAEISHILQGFQLLAETQQIVLNNEITDTVEVLIDKNILHTIVRNLLSNAIKFTPEKGQITVSVEIKNVEIDKKITYITITDTGVGIAEEKLAQLFQVQNNKSTAGLRGEKGIGIGLNLCYELALLAGADLQARSEVGRGTTFCLTV